MNKRNGIYAVSELVLPRKNSNNKETKPLTMKDQMYSRLRCWCDETTSHGIALIIKRKRIYSKIIWLIFTLAAIGLCVYMIHRSLTQYLQFDVTTTIRRETKKDVPFPVISICNANQMVTPEASDYIRDYFNAKFNLNVTTFEELLEEFKHINDTSYDKEMSWLIYQTYDANFNDSLKKSFGYPLEIMIYSAFWNSENLDITESFEWYYNFKFGNCYRFNYKPREDGSFYPQTFTNEGLRLDLFVGLPESLLDYFYYPDMKGFYLLIEDQGSFPILKEGILIHPGTFTKISYSRVHTETESYPYSDCIDADKVDTLMSREMKKINMKYNRRNCLDLLLAKIAIDQIGCYEQNFPKIFNSTPCSNETAFQNLSSVSYDFDNYFQYCPFECESKGFDLTISTLEYPSYNSYRQLMTDYENSYESYLFQTNNLTFEMYKNSFAYVYIEIDDLRVTHISESPSITLPDLLSNLGGTLGLFIGVSILSFVEFLELGIEMLAIFVKSIRRRN